MDFKNIWVNDKKLLEKCYALRIEIFCDEQGFEVDRDEIDDISHHFLMLDGDVAVGTLRMFVDGENLHTGRICIKKTYRGKGIGKLMMDECIKKARELNLGENLILGAQYDKADFYSNCGFEKYGDFFEDEGYPHIMMKYKLK